MLISSNFLRAHSWCYCAVHIRSPGGSTLQISLIVWIPTRAPYLYIIIPCALLTYNSQKYALAVMPQMELSFGGWLGLSENVGCAKSDASGH